VGKRRRKTHCEREDDGELGLDAKFGWKQIWTYELGSRVYPGSTRFLALDHSVMLSGNINPGLRPYPGPYLTKSISQLGALARACQGTLPLELVNTLLVKHYSLAHGRETSFDIHGS